jgi:hypothetical protein
MAQYVETLPNAQGSAGQGSTRGASKPSAQVEKAVEAQAGADKAALNEVLTSQAFGAPPPPAREANIPSKTRASLPSAPIGAVAALSAASGGGTARTLLIVMLLIAVFAGGAHVRRLRR